MRAAPSWVIAPILMLCLTACGQGNVAPQGAAPGTQTSGKPRAVASTAASTTPTHILVAYNGPTVGFSPLFVGEDAGIFRKNGLDVTLQLITGAPASTAALLAGQVQFSQVGGGAAMTAAAGGADLVVLAVNSPVVASVLEAAPSIKTGADLKGKKIGLTSLAGGGDAAAEQMKRMMLRRSIRLN